MGPTHGVPATGNILIIPGWEWDAKRRFWWSLVVNEYLPRPQSQGRSMIYRTTSLDLCICPCREPSHWTGMSLRCRGTRELPDAKIASALITSVPLSSSIFLYNVSYHPPDCLVVCSFIYKYLPSLGAQFLRSRDFYLLTDVPPLFSTVPGT